MRFSFSLFLISSSLHAAGSILLGVASYAIGMGAFTHDVSTQMNVLRILGWIIAPPQMVMLNHPSGVSGPEPLMVATFVWSGVVGLGLGCFIPTFRARTHGKNQAEQGEKAKPDHAPS
ncbi:MAG: hypothetical protein AAGA96_15280 [Verrucomicrobiota bacterium]